MRKQVGIYEDIQHTDDYKGMGATISEKKSASYEKLVKGIKKNKKVDNPWALAHWIEKKKMMKESDGKRIDSFEIVDHGLEGRSYFQGHGIAMTKWDDTATGVGMSAKEALDDAIEQLAQNGWEISDDLESELKAASNQVDVPEDAEDMYHYVSVDVKGADQSDSLKESSEEDFVTIYLKPGREFNDHLVHKLEKLIGRKVALGVYGNADKECIFLNIYTKDDEIIKRTVDLIGSDKVDEVAESITESKLKVGDKVKVSGLSGLDSGKSGVIINRSEVKTNGIGIPKNVKGAYKPVEWSKELAVRLDNGDIITMPKNRLIRESEDMDSRSDDEIIKMYQDMSNSQLRDMLNAAREMQQMMDKQHGKDSHKTPIWKDAARHARLIKGVMRAGGLKESASKKVIKESSGSEYIYDLANTLLSDAISSTLENEELTEIPEEAKKEMLSAMVFPGAEVTETVPEYFKENDFNYHRYLPTGIIQEIEKDINTVWEGKATLEQLYYEYPKGAHSVVMQAVGMGVSLIDDEEGKEWLEAHGLDSSKQAKVSRRYEFPSDLAYWVIMDFCKFAKKEGIFSESKKTDCDEKMTEDVLKTAAQLLGKPKMIEMAKELEFDINAALDKKGIKTPNKEEVKVRISGYSEPYIGESKKYSYPELLDITIESGQNIKLALRGDGRYILEGRDLTGKGLSREQVIEMVCDDVAEWGIRVMKHMEKKKHESK